MTLPLQRRALRQLQLLWKSMESLMEWLLPPAFGVKEARLHVHYYGPLILCTELPLNNRHACRCRD